MFFLPFRLALYGRAAFIVEGTGDFVNAAAIDRQ